ILFPRTASPIPLPSPLSLHDALPILGASLAHEINQPLAAIVTNARAAIRLLEQGGVEHRDVSEALTDIAADAERASAIIGRLRRSEEHTSELQSRSDLVCRLLLEKKK